MIERLETAFHTAPAVSSASGERAFLLQRDSDACGYCWACVRYCPARAIRVIDGRTEIIEERCVKCGLCVSECGNGGFKIRDDVPEVRRLLASDRPVVVVLATEYVAALHPRLPDEVERALEEVGFHAVETTLLGEELVALEYERIHTKQVSMLSLRSTCPVVVDWVRLFYPELVSALAPIVPPYIAQARLVRSMYADDVAVVYVSPCYARKDEIFDPQFAGAVDVVIDFTELERLLASAKIRSRVPGARTASRPPVPLKEISLTDGFPRTTLAGNA
ncbi:MAG: [Fe-Fe] hydrogenase large subunit C-terminal domain-containing protein, partial [Actinomycetota bacterium]|nr:[Fe-Fe] hydrogenase large subunit C-terminal domain-containing protein [Actinomycetota bacterium]